MNHRLPWPNGLSTAVMTLVLLLLPAAVPAMAAPASTPAPSNTAQYPIDAYVLRVDGLACPYCAYGIEKQFSGMAGVTDTRINIEKGVVIVQVKPGTRYGIEQIRTAVHDAGFTLKRVVSRPQAAR